MKRAKNRTDLGKNQPMAVFNQCVEAPRASEDKAGIEFTDPNKENKQ